MIFVTMIMFLRNLRCATETVISDDDEVVI
jgi:hypothetical protein